MELGGGVADPVVTGRIGDRLAEQVLLVQVQVGVEGPDDRTGDRAVIGLVDDALHHEGGGAADGQVDRLLGPRRGDRGVGFDQQVAAGVVGADDEIGGRLLGAAELGGGVADQVAPHVVGLVTTETLLATWVLVESPDDGMDDRAEIGLVDDALHHEELAGFHRVVEHKGGLVPYYAVHNEPMLRLEALDRLERPRPEETRGHSSSGTGRPSHPSSVCSR